MRGPAGSPVEARDIHPVSIGGRERGGTLMAHRRSRGGLMAEVFDIRKSVTVGAPVDQAFAIFAERPLEWWPKTHVFVEDRRAITIEPRIGGRYFERGSDGTEVDWGTVVEWDPPNRLVLTWRVGADWQPVHDDEKASFIEVDFVALDRTTTRVTLTHAQLHRHGEVAEFIHAALDGPSPGETLAKYAEVVAEHTPAAV
jgi:uncharacterized protein YndB with AHSA1/START domain